MEAEMVFIRACRAKVPAHLAGRIEEHFKWHPSERENSTAPVRGETHPDNKSEAAAFMITVAWQLAAVLAPEDGDAIEDLLRRAFKWQYGQIELARNPRPARA